jgi:hypothetical protein
MDTIPDEAIAHIFVIFDDPLAMRALSLLLPPSFTFWLLYFQFFPAGQSKHIIQFLL